MSSPNDIPNTPLELKLVFLTLFYYTVFHLLLLPSMCNEWILAPFCFVCFLRRTKLIHARVLMKSCVGQIDTTKGQRFAFKFGDVLLIYVIPIFLRKGRMFSLVMSFVMWLYDPSHITSRLRLYNFSFFVNTWRLE